MTEKIKYAPLGALSTPDALALVLECDREFDAALEAKVARICKVAPKVIRLSGPTCSGKSTVVKKIVAEPFAIRWLSVNNCKICLFELPLRSLRAKSRRALSYERAF